MAFLSYPPSPFFEGLEGSSLLAKLEAKFVSDEAIIDADFFEAQEADHLNLDINFDKIAEQEEEAATKGTEGEQKECDVPHFRDLLEIHNHL